MIVIRERISWWSKLKQSFVGFLFSFLLVLVALAVLAWNEHRTLKTHKGLAAAAAAVVSADPARLDPALNGKLVHLRGTVEGRGSVRDAVFGVEAQALVLERSVEMYQWREKTETREEQKLGGGTEKVTTYRYEQSWASSPIDSSRFKDARHRNPSEMPWREERQTVAEARLGAWLADDRLLRALQSVPLELAEYGSFPAGFRRVDQATLYRGADPARPAIGDIRVRFRAVPAQAASVIGQAQGEKLLPWTSPSGSTVYLVSSGSQEAKAMLADAQSSNTLWAWALRGGGFALLWMAFSMMLAPLATVAGVLPPLGRLVGMLSGWFAFLLAAVVAGVTILLSWLFVRPLWSVSLVLALVAVIAMWSRRNVGVTPLPEATMRSVPPPPPPHR